MLNFSASFELKGVVVKLTNRWFTISIILPGVEVKLENDTLSEVLKLGSWVILHATGKVYEIVRQCSEVLPTYVYKDLVLLKTNICFQERGQEGYGRWVWSPELGRIAAICHDRYKPKQNYVALVSSSRTTVFFDFRKPTKYQFVIEYNWMLTKYIDEPSVNLQFDVIFQEHRICNGRKNLFNKGHKVHCNDSGDNYFESTVDDEHFFFDDLEVKKHENLTSNNIYAIITKVVSNPNVRLAMQKYRPKELFSMCEALSLKSSKLFIGHYYMILCY
ncbi:unnamed protein product [Cercopithifilaria johnstoni]|uniref:Uncharacterized protein n=1 Tax=Cercopithifilaria johnstoni TaxID=2874296 RepID=A0A8J2QBA5_9BILA|nr:unnamed protein product [Cercopithifilaria johnstoni]